MTSQKVLIGLSLMGLLAGCAKFETTPSTDDVVTANSNPGDSIWYSRSAKVDPTRLPLGDQHYVTEGAKKGYIFACDAKMFQQTDGPGASEVGNWVNKEEGIYDVTRKTFIQGSVKFTLSQFSVTVVGGARKVVSNGLPFGVTTGTFPVQATDPAYAIDRNPNEITVQDIAFSIPASPLVASQDSCIYKEVGITLDGVPLHGPLNSTGDNELAYELQDNCMGGAQPGGGYHRHALSNCTPHIRENNALVGYALDGFGIFSPYDENGVEISSADLDECHGLTSKIQWEGQTVQMYHYVLTRDFPYSVSCFKGKPTRNAFPRLPGAPLQPTDGTSVPPVSGGNIVDGIDTSCPLFQIDSQKALTHIAGETGAQCKQELSGLTQLYVQFRGKTCSEIQSLFSSLTKSGGSPPPPAPGSQVYQELVKCSNK